jgi:acetamidase/formamidase
MTIHRLGPAASSAHGIFSRELAPALSIASGDTVVFQTLDAGWGALEQEPGFTVPKAFSPRDLTRDVAHCLTGPVRIEGARPGMVLEIRIRRLRVGRWGWSAGSTLPAQMDAALGLPASASGPPAVIEVPQGDDACYWTLDPDTNRGVNRNGVRLALHPFLGVMGMPLDVAGVQSTFPPTPCGGNMDCRELVEGTTLFLPIVVEGGLFSCGDGHAVQGDGEVAGPALACPMEAAELEFHLRPDLSFAMPRARTAKGWLTFGFHRDLTEAWTIAAREMVRLMQELYGLPPKEALSLAGLVAHLSITQAVNGVRGVHALLPHDALEFPVRET